MLRSSFILEEKGVDPIRAVGIIPARGGSKGVLGKNIRLLGGKPLLSYTVEAAIKSRLDRTIVSTEDEKIAAVARKYGAETPFLRPKELATDEASSLSVLLHALHYLENEEQYYPDIVAFLQPTSPFRTHEHINEGLRTLLASDVDSVVGVCGVEADSHPYFVHERDEEGNLKELIEIRNKPLRRQELPELFRMSDGLVITRRRYFDNVGENSPCFNPKSMKGLVMDRISSIGIDDEFDFLLAEFVVKSGLFRPAVKSV